MLASTYPGQIFFDTESIPAGAYFKREIKQRMEECAVLLAVIGDHWINAKYDEGPLKDQLRLGDSEDQVRAEIEAALTQRLHVVPVLVGRRMPTAAELPPSLRELAIIHAFDLLPGKDLNERLTELIAGLRKFIPRDDIFGNLSGWLKSLSPG